jgi:hypothetical protein
MSALLDLLSQADCDIFLMPADAPLYSNLLMSVLLERPMQTFDLPDFAYFIDVDPEMQPYSWNRTYEDSKHDPLAVFHTSGSTGVPKLMIMNHGVVAALDAFGSFTGPKIQSDTLKGRRHCCSFQCSMPRPSARYFCPYGIPFQQFYRPPIPLTPELANDMIVNCNIEAAIMPQSILSEIAGNQTYLANLWKCTSVMYEGGPLPTEAGAHGALQVFGPFTNFYVHFFCWLCHKQLERPHTRRDRSRLAKGGDYGLYTIKACHRVSCSRYRCYYWCQKHHLSSWSAGWCLKS